MAYSDLTPEQRKILEADNLKPFANNNRLKELFLSVDKVLIKKGGVYNDKAIGKEVSFAFESQGVISELAGRLQVEEPKEVQYCMCAGSYAIELYSREKLKATIGLHHGKAIRYIGWKGDAELSDGRGLLEWLAAKGYGEPLLNYQSR